MSQSKELYAEIALSRNQWQEPMQVLCTAFKNFLSVMDQDDPRIKLIAQQIKVAEDSFASSTNKAFQTFCGEGTIARWKRERIIGKIADNKGKITPTLQKALDDLEVYNLNPTKKFTWNSEAAAALTVFDCLVDGTETRIPFIGEIEDLSETFHIPTGLYKHVGEGNMPVFVINEQVNSNPNLRYYVQIAPGKTYILHVYHELEDFIAPMSADLYFDSFPEDIKIIAENYFEDQKVDAVRNFQNEYEELNKKANIVFDNLQYMGLAADNQDKSVIVLSSGIYNFVYRLSEYGDKKFVTGRIEIDPGNTAVKFGTTIRVEDIPQDQSERVFNEVNLQMGRMIDVIDANKKPSKNAQ